MTRRLVSTLVVAALLVTTVAASVLFALTGCGTLTNLQEKPELLFTRDPDAPPKRIYGGVRISAEEGWKDLTGGWGLVPGTCRWVVDVPLSAVGDTLTLPVTIPATLARTAARKKALQQCPPDYTLEGRELAPAGVKSGISGSAF
jgi:uncharacterized protein YceK